MIEVIELYTRRRIERNAPSGRTVNGCKEGDKRAKNGMQNAAMRYRCCLTVQSARNLADTYSTLHILVDAKAAGANDWQGNTG